MTTPADHSQQPVRERQVDGRFRVCVPAAEIGAVSGFLAGLGYSVLVSHGGEGHLYGSLLPDNRYVIGLGLITGIVVGIVAGVWWAGQMTWRVQCGRLFKPRRSGAWLGLQSGVGATIALHVVLGLAQGRLDGALLLTGLGFGVLLGPSLGSVMGGRSPWTKGQTDAAL